MRTIAETDQLVSKIKQLKKKKNAVILAHNYQKSEIYDVADYIGDSLGLCLEAAKTDADIILFCGVNFMAESAAVLNPDKKVIVPFIDAGCAMADMVDTKGLKKLQDENPDAVTVCYVNSTAEVKAMSHVCCTSANAVKVVSSLPNKKIIFVPDKNLAAYVQRDVPDKEIIAWDGFCPIHHSLTEDRVAEIRSTHPKASLIAHPECRPEVIEAADHTCSTSKMIEAAKNDPAEEFFVITECGMVDRLQRALPEKKFSGLCNVCFDMKKNDLEAALKALETEGPVIEVDKKIAQRANQAFENMFKLS